MSILRIKDRLLDASGYVAGTLGLIAPIVAGWIFIDGYFAKASELNEIYYMLEISQNRFRIDIIQDRHYREIRQTPKDQAWILMLERELDTLNREYDDIQHKYSRG